MDEFDFSDTDGPSYSIHLRIQQRNTRKSITTVQGLPPDFAFEDTLTAWRKKFCCSGTLVDDKQHGTVVQVTGDQRENIQKELVRLGYDKDYIFVHGF